MIDRTKVPLAARCKTGSLADLAGFGHVVGLISVGLRTNNYKLPSWERGKDQGDDNLTKLVFLNAS